MVPNSRNQPVLKREIVQLATIHTYPTLAEANKYAAGEWRRAHAPERALRWLERYHAWRRG